MTNGFFRGVKTGLFWLCIVFILVAGTCVVRAQNLDLNIPGMKEQKPPAATTTASPSPTSSKQTLMDMFWLGGWCMWPLLGFSLGVVGLSAYLTMSTRRKNFCPDALVSAIQPDMERGDVEAALTKLQASPTCLSVTLLAGFGYLAEKGFGVLESEKLDEVMGDAARAFNRNRVRLLNYFSVLAQAAPMVGLLGTVSGMIKAFANLGREGMGDPSKLAANISEALITTATGLIIALPAIFCYHLFKDRLQNLVHECDEKIIEQMTHLRRAVAAYDAQQSGHETSD